MKNLAWLVVVGGLLLLSPASSSMGVAAERARQTAGDAAVKAASAGDLADRLSRMIPGLMDDAAVPGVQIAILRDGAPAWVGLFGLANATTGAPVTEASVFEAASLSKPVFAYAMLTLVDAGLMDLDTPVSTYLPGGYDVGDDARLGQMTARHILSHRSGFPNWRSGAGGLKILLRSR